MSTKEIAKNAIVPFASALVGGLIVVAGLKLIPSHDAKASADMNRDQSAERIYDDIFKKQQSIHHQFDDLLNSELAAQNEPFEAMKKMRKQMQEHMEGIEDRNHSVSNPFESWFSDKFGDGTINDIGRREDDQFVYYDVKLDDVNATSINAKVEGGYVTISGTTERKSGSDAENNDFTAQSIFKSSFNRTFPLPENVDQKKLQMLTEKDKVVLKFPKIKV